MRGLNLVAVMALSSSFACAAQVPAEIVEPEPRQQAEPQQAEPLAATALTDAPAPTNDDPNLEPDPRAQISALEFPGFPAAPLRSEVSPDGLEIYDYTLGVGMAAQSGDRVRIHYVGMLLDGTEFDSTHARSTPFEIELGRGRMIPGMERGLEGVRPGMRRTLVIPPELAYKERALGQIPAHATLVFHVEVLSVEPPPPLPPPQPHP